MSITTDKTLTHPAKLAIAFSNKPWNLVEKNSNYALVKKIALTALFFLVNFICLFIPMAFANKHLNANIITPRPTKITDSVSSTRKLEKQLPKCPKKCKYNKIKRYNKRKRILRSFLRLCKVQWLHGTNSTAMPIIRRTGNKLTATGILLNEHHVAPPCGELDWGIGEGGINLTSLSGVSVANYGYSIIYAKANRNKNKEQSSNFTSELKHLRDLEPKNIMDSTSMVSLLRVIRFGNHEEKKQVLGYLQKIKDKVKSSNFCVPRKCLEQSTNIVIEEKDLQKEKLKDNEVKIGDLVVVKRSDGTKRTAVLIYRDRTCRNTFFSNIEIKVVVDKGAIEYFPYDSMFALTQQKKEELEKGPRKLFEEKIQKLITLCKKPSMISDYKPYELEEKNSPFPIVFGTTKQSETVNSKRERTGYYGSVKSDIRNEIAIKGSIELGGTGINVAFTDEKHLDRLKNSLKDNPDIHVHPFSVMKLIYDYVNILEVEGSDNKKITKVFYAIQEGSLSYARNLYDQRVKKDEILRAKLTFPGRWKSY